MGLKGSSKLRQQTHVRARNTPKAAHEDDLYLSQLRMQHGHGAFLQEAHRQCKKSVKRGFIAHPEISRHDSGFALTCMLRCFTQGGQSTVSAPSSSTLPTGTVLGQVAHAWQLHVHLQACIQPRDAVSDFHDHVYATSQLCQR